MRSPAKDILGLAAGQTVLFVFKNDATVDVEAGKYVYDYARRDADTRQGKGHHHHHHRQGHDTVTAEEWIVTGQRCLGIPLSVRNAKANNARVVCVRQPVDGERVVEGVGTITRIDTVSNKVVVAIDRPLTEGEKAVVRDAYVAACETWRMFRPTRDPATGNVIGWKKLCMIEVCGAKSDPRNRTATCFLLGRVRP